MLNKPETIVHVHVHGEESALDGLSTIKQLIARAVEIGSPALGLTDHGVMSGIADFIKECEEANIKPIPGCEAYMTENRQLQSKELERMREYIGSKYKITDNKGKFKKKAFNNFIKTIKKDFSCFETEASLLLQSYLMDEEMDLFDIMNQEDKSTDEKLDEFKQDILEYLDYADNYHLLLLAVNNQGLKDLYKIISDSHINGFYSDPRTDLRYIRRNGLGKNIIATSACLGSYFARLIMQNRREDAISFIQECKETFHSFYLEKQATLIREQIYLNKVIDELSIKTNTPKIITTDVHFARKEDHRVHDILVAGSMNKCVLDEDRYHYAEDHYLKTVEEIRKHINDEEAIANTLEIAEIVNVTLPKEPLFPKFIIESEDSAEAILRKKSWNSLFQYCLRNTEIDYYEYAKRLDYELDVICNEGFADYFLITEDFVNAAKDEGFLIGPGRGSGAGSLVCFVLSITTLDPIEHKLLFERFLNPERVGYPDIDLDFSYEAAQWTQEYLKRKYGKDHVAQIGTKGTLAARAAIRFVSKAMGYSEKGNLTLEDAFATAIPATPGISLSEAHSQEEKVRNYAKQYPEWWQVACALEGHIRSFGVHAAGVVISPEPLTNIVPLRLDKQGLVTTQYTMDWIEKLLVKFDLLKLDTLDLIKLTMTYADMNPKAIESINLNDPLVYENIYNKLRLNGIFQVESDGMKDVIEKLQPNCFADIGIILALYRPGPMDLIPSYINRKFGREAITYPFEELKPVLDETYGIWCYQEQIMSASQILGGLTLGQADMIRKGVAKKKPKLMNRWIDLMIYGSNIYKTEQIKLYKQYSSPDLVPKDSGGHDTIWVDFEEIETNFKGIPEVEGAIGRGFDLNTLLELKKQWIKFGEYCFNKAHSASYAKISVQTAWLKNYYPAEFLAALLTISEGKKDKSGDAKSIKYMRECEEMNIGISPPDINESKANWTPISNVEKGNNIDFSNYSEDLSEFTKKPAQYIRYGLGSIAGISEESVQAIIDAQPYKSIQMLVEKTDSRKVNKTKVVNLIKSGAFDSINKNRNKLLIDYGNLKGEQVDLPSTTGKSTIIQYERETLGTSVTIKSRWETIEDGKTDIQFTGNLKTIDPFMSKKGQEHARVTIETNEDILNGLIFNRQWKDLKNQLIIGQRVIAKGKKDNNTFLINNLRAEV
ncbi:DNA polymerase III subunit alpha [Virgibacillus salexigens]|uniref:DNA-directed DNA polymerase n=1 Tax=Virgibacillus massiliensis TaxID=1462526 RepID=A0A024QIG6_9BACI|nr:DNA polymerase III subunit alpha [Virgibacillus massiliensis]CDQ41756.1 DNA polymerase III subunit alpha [Virgibacillus massiliensis]